MSNPALEKKEEQMHKDLDGDGEKDESPAHRARVLGKKKEIPSGGLKKGKSILPPKTPKGSKMAPVAKKKGMTGY